MERGRAFAGNKSYCLNDGSFSKHQRTRHASGLVVLGELADWHPAQGDECPSIYFPRRLRNG